MRGRAQASLVALLGSWFPLISPATVSLVTLRRGSLDGLVILLWALLPPLGSLWLSDMAPLMLVVTVMGLVTSLLAALMLRSKGSWPQALFGLVALSSLMAWLIGSVMSNPVSEITQALGEVFEQIQAQDPETPAMPIQFTDTYVLGLIAYVLAVSSLMSVLVARWWQAILYNPGGFQVEFHNLRLSPLGGATSFLAVLYCWNQSLDYQYWAMVFALPLTVAAAGLAHGVVKLRQLSGYWLIVFYLALVFVSPLVLVFAMLDTWTDFRSRIRGAVIPPNDRDNDNQ